MGDNDYNMFVDAMNFMYASHHGQTDKLDEPYWKHPMAVAAVFVQLRDYYHATIALLHDVVEDTVMTLDALSQQFPASVVGAVDALTRREGETYKEYVRRCAENRDAAKVKWVDLQDNLGTVYDTRIQLNDSMVERYYWALGYLASKYGWR